MSGYHDNITIYNRDEYVCWSYNVECDTVRANTLVYCIVYDIVLRCLYLTSLDVL